jgi:hypothetical protein
MEREVEWVMGEMRAMGETTMNACPDDMAQNGL